MTMAVSCGLRRLLVASRPVEGPEAAARCSAPDLPAGGAPPPLHGAFIAPALSPADQARSKRSRFITFVHAATKSRTNRPCASALP